MPSDLPPPIDPPTQAALLMVLLGFVLLGIAMIAATMIGARWVRRINRAKLSKGWQPEFQTNEPIDYEELAQKSDKITKSSPSTDETQSDSTDRRETEVE